MRDELIRRHYSQSITRSYIYWLKQYFYFHQLKHPALLSAQDIQSFLNHLTINRHVAASTQSQALNALAFLYKQILKIEPGELTELVRPKRFGYLPVVLTPTEVKSILEAMRGHLALAASLLCGTRMRINECVTLRVQDIDLTIQSITIRNTKGRRSRVTLLPDNWCSRYLAT